MVLTSSRRFVSEHADVVRTHRLGVDEAQLRLRNSALEQALPCAQYDREDHQAVPIDESVLGKASNERRAAGDEDVAFDLFLETPNLTPPGCHLGSPSSSPT